MKAVLEGRKTIAGGPFHFNKDQVYKRVKWMFEQAGIKDSSPHTLRKTAGAWYYMATRDIFATSKFLGHSSVVVTGQHYAGLIQSLQVEYTRMFEDTLWKQASGNLQLTCNYEGKPGQGRVIEKLEEPPPFSSEKGGYRGAGPTRFELATSGLTGRRSNQAELRSLIFTLLN